MWTHLEKIVSRILADTSQAEEEDIRLAMQEWADFLAAIRKLVPPPPAAAPTE